MNKILLVLCIVLCLNDFVKAPVLPEGFTLNPYGKTPLSGIYKSSSNNHLPVTITIVGKQRSMSISYTFSENYGNTFPIHGLYNNYTNTIIIFSGNTKILQTNIYIEDVYKKQKLQYKKNPSRMRVHTDINHINDPFNQDMYFMYDNYTNITAYDRKGELRYIYQKENEFHTMTRIEKFNNEFYMYFVDKKIYRANLLGQERYYPIFSFSNIKVHHEFSYKGSNMIVLAVSGKGGLEDRIVEIDSLGFVKRDLIIGDMFRNSVPKSKWNEFKKTIYDTNNMYTNRITMKPIHIDWAHANSIIYDQDTDILYLSLRHLGVLAVKYTDWMLVWWLADDNINVQKGTTYGTVPADFLYLSDIDSIQSYRLNTSITPRNQHGLLLKKNGNLMMFDNQGDAHINFKGSRVLEYKITINSNQKGGTAEIINQIVHPKKVYSRLLSDIDLIGSKNNDFLILWGFDTPLTLFKTARISEFDKTGKLIFDMSLGVDWVYRVEKKPLYPYQDTKKQYSIDVLEKDEL